MSQRYAKYKGRVYKLLWTGTTKFGQKAKLAFLDGSQEFWADLALCELDVPRPAASSRKGGVCAECGRGGKLVRDLEDGLLKHYACCDIPPT